MPTAPLLDQNAPGSRPRRAERGIVKPFSSLLLAQVIGTALGTGFWLVVARLMPSREVGIAAGAISSQTLVGFFAAMGVGTLLIVELPRHEPARQRVLMTRGLLSVAVVGGGVGTAVAILAGPMDLLGETLHLALGRPAGFVVFVLGVIAAAAAVVIDESMLGLKRSNVQVWRNLLASGVRFPLAAGILAVGMRDPLVLQWCWVAPLLGSVLVVLVVIPLPWRGAVRVPFVQDVVHHAGAALRNHGLNLAVAAGSQLVPVVAAVSLAPSDNAAFAIAWLGATFVFLPPYLLAVALFAHGANASTEEFRESMRWTIPAAMTLSLGLCLLSWGAGRPVLRLFGDHYASQSWLLLSILAPAGLWMVIKDHLVALWRAQRRYGLATRLAAAGLVIEISGAVAGGVLGGPVWLCAGWLIAMGVEALLAVPWMREAFSGMRLHIPTRVARGSRRSVTAGHAAVLLAALLSVGALVVVLVRPGPIDSGQASPGAHGATTGERTGTDLCRPSAARPGPALDLGVQGAIDLTTSRSPREINRLVALASGAGASVISTGISWATVQTTPGAPLDLLSASRVVDAARARHLRVRVQLFGAPAWAVPSGSGQWRPPTTAGEIRLWQEFVAEVLDELGPIDYLEVWTEPDNPDYWPDPDADDFMRLVSATDQTVQRVAPKTEIVSGGLDGNDVEFLQQMLAAAKGQSLPMDFLGLHPFSGGRAPTAVPLDGDEATAFLGYREMHRVLAEAGFGSTELYVGEFGYPATLTDQQVGNELTDRERATYAREALGLATCTPYLGVFSWYYLHPTMWDPAAWALLTSDLTPTRTYEAIKTWSAQRGSVL